MRMTSSERAIDKIYRRRDRYDIPDWQREEVWDRAKKRALIDSILRSWKLPKFYFLKLSDDPEEFEVVDGQQRLATIFEFFDNELDLTKQTAAEFGGFRYTELPQSRQDAFDDFEIQFDVIEDAEESDIKEFFQRLQAGLPLTSSEKLNAVHSNLRDFARKLAKYSFFRTKVYLSDTRYAHFDIASKVAAIEIEGLDAGLRYEELKETFESQSSFSARSQVARRLQETFDYLDRVFPAKSTLLRHRTIVQSFATLAARLVTNGKVGGYETRLREFFEAFMKNLSKQVEMGATATDHDYLAFQRTVNANVRSGARIRNEVLLRKLLVFDPAAADLLGTGVVAESGLAVAIKRSAAAIASAVEDVNTRYAAKHGSDLIKPTNKTTGALGRLAKPIDDYQGYSKLIDDLYFVFHEGVGQRLDDSNRPASFTDINLLRTGVRHDLDHGAVGKVRKKVRGIAEAFTRYAGAPTPQSLDPSQFRVVQANLLATLESDLATITP